MVCKFSQASVSDLSHESKSLFLGISFSQELISSTDGGLSFEDQESSDLLLELFSNRQSQVARCNA